MLDHWPTEGTCFARWKGAQMAGQRAARGPFGPAATHCAAPHYRGETETSAEEIKPSSSIPSPTQRISWKTSWV